MITLQVNIENEIYANMFAELISNFNFVNSVEIPELSKSYRNLLISYDETLVLPAEKNGDPSKYCGIWADKGISDVKQFRKDLWQRSKYIVCDTNSGKQKNTIPIH